MRTHLHKTLQPALKATSLAKVVSVLAAIALSGGIVWRNIAVLTDWPVKAPSQLLTHYLVAPITILLVAGAIVFCGKYISVRFAPLLDTLSTTEGKSFYGSFLASWVFLVAIVITQSPGWITEDAIYTNHMARSGYWSGWYSPLNPLIYTVLLQIVPSILFVTICNATLTAIVIAQYCRESAKFLRSVTLPLLVATITSTLPVTMAMALMPIRDSFFTCLFLLFIILSYRCLFENTKAGQPALIAALGGAVSVYRVDAAPSILALLGALALFAPVNFKRKVSIGATQALSFAAIFIMMSSIPLVLGSSWDRRAESEYKMTIIALPLTNLVRDGVYPDYSDPRRQAIEKVFPYEGLKRLWHPTNILVFYGGGFNEKSSLSERDAAAVAAISLFIDHPRSFLAGRFSLFLANTGLSTMESFHYNSDDELRRRNIETYQLPKMVSVVGEKFKMLMDDTKKFDGTALHGSFIFWNIVPSLVVFFVAIACWQYCPKAALVSVSLLLREVVVFLAAPAAFFHYHYSTYIGSFLIALLAYSEWKASARAIS